VETEQVFITLGSNINPEANLPEAVRRLAGRVTVRAASHVYQSAPLDAAGRPVADQGYFLNAAVLIETDQLPAALKFDVLRPIEAAMGRARTADKYAPRPIDLDIALYGRRVFDDLAIPDPEIATRAHVALPLSDLAPGYIHPLTGQTLAAIAQALAGSPGITRHPLELNASD
jgi:2-amino-4-hydroxy-6-hydroxymethyldihydropteridine diphosphokinase